MTLPYITPLTAQQLRSVGIGEPWAFGMQDLVRFGEVDSLNHVNNVAYLRWYETLRVHYLDHYDIYNLAGPDPKIVLKSANLDYRAEVRRGETYINVTRTAEMRNTSFSMEHATIVDGKVTTTCTCIIVLLNADNTKRPLPEALRETLIARDGAVQV